MQSRVDTRPYNPQRHHSQQFLLRCHVDKMEPEDQLQ